MPAHGATPVEQAIAAVLIAVAQRLQSTGSQVVSAGPRDRSWRRRHRRWGSWGAMTNGTARGELKKFVCLLVLGRQRPVNERTMRELLRLLRQSPLIAGAGRLASVGGLSVHDDIVVRRSLALQLLDNMLRGASDDPTVKKYENQARQTITRAASYQRTVMERLLEGGPSHQGLQTPLSVLQGKHDGTDHEIWEPSDSAYYLLWSQNVSESVFEN